MAAQGYITIWKTQGSGDNSIGLYNPMELSHKTLCWISITLWRAYLALYSNVLCDFLFPQGTHIWQDMNPMPQGYSPQGYITLCRHRIFSIGLYNPMPAQRYFPQGQITLCRHRVFSIGLYSPMPPQGYFPQGYITLCRHRVFSIGLYNPMPAQGYFPQGYITLCRHRVFSIGLYNPMPPQGYFHRVI